MIYDPATDTTENLGMPMPLDDKRSAAGKTEGEGVIDVTADEGRGLIYVITCEEQHWMLYDMKTKKYRDLGPILRDQPNTLIDAQGRGTAITADYQVARYDPPTDKVTVDPLLVDGKPFAEYLGAKRVHPDWRITPDGKTAYLQLLNDLRMFRVDLSGAAGKPVAGDQPGQSHQGQEPRFARLDLHRPRRPRLLGRAHRQQDRLRHGLPAPPRAPRPADRGDGRPGRVRRQESGLLRLQGPPGEEPRRLRCGRVTATTRCPTAR